MPLLLSSLFFFIPFATFISNNFFFLIIFCWLLANALQFHRRLLQIVFISVWLNAICTKRSLCVVCAMCTMVKSFAHINTHTRVAPSLSHSLAPHRIHPRHLLLLSSMHIVHLLLIHIACFVILVSHCFAPSFDSTMFSIQTRRPVCGAVRQTLVEVSSGSDFIYCLDDEIAMFFHLFSLSHSLSSAKILCPYYCWCFFAVVFNSFRKICCCIRCVHRILHILLKYNLFRECFFRLPI